MACLALAILAFYLTPTTATVSGRFYSEQNQPISDGYYDIRLMAYDRQTGKVRLSQDFADTYVRSGVYNLDLKLPRFMPDSVSYMQMCRSVHPTDTADGVGDAIPEGCREPVEQRKTYTYAECPLLLSLGDPGGINDLLGESSAWLSGHCYSNVELAEELVFQHLAPTTATIPPVVQPQQFAAGTGADGRDGQDGRDGRDGVDGVDGRDGANG
ncbi:hypothetical protein CR970_04170, partial [Candidatus Saccharibacteria bacterium]